MIAVAPLALALLFGAAPSSPSPQSTQSTSSTQSTPSTQPTAQPAARARLADAAPADLEALLARLAALPDVRARVVAASEGFLGVPYQFDPLGEGPGAPPDEDPRLRFDQADCQTFVETVLALTRARSAAGLLEALDRVRYQGAPAYAHRHHFFEAQWVPALSREGYVRDATAAIAGKDAVRHVKEVTRAQWEQRTMAEKVALPDERAPVGRFPLAYVPLAKIVARAAEVPSGTLFAVVREDRPLTPTMVSHLGFVVQKPEGTFLRHAGRELYASVVDEPVARFVERNAEYKKWPVLGLWLLEVVEPPPVRP